LKIKEDKIFRVHGGQAFPVSQDQVKRCPFQTSDFSTGLWVGGMWGSTVRGMEIGQDKGWRDAMPNCVTRHCKETKKKVDVLEQPPEN